MFNIGDKVIGNKQANIYSFTKEGWIGTVKQIWPDNYMKVEDETGHRFIVKTEYFDLHEPVIIAPDDEFISIMF